ncbi:MAG: antitoxin family protein [Chloroflexi bacterium]|nr:antitoxin family protein [Chloroflexota bacterium]
MSYQVNAIFEDGVLKLLEPLSLPEHRVLHLIVTVPFAMEADAELAAWQQVLTGLSGPEVDEIEKISLEREHFMGQVN